MRRNWEENGSSEFGRVEESARVVRSEEEWVRAAGKRRRQGWEVGMDAGAGRLGRRGRVPRGAQRGVIEARAGLLFSD